MSALVLASFIHFVGRITLRPDLCLVHYSIQEAGNQLYRPDLVRSGRVMYRDFACQYGPLPTYAYTAVAAAAGNNALTNQWFHFAFRLTAALLVYATLRRSLNAAGSSLASLFVVLPTVLPDAGLGTYTHIEYISIEVALFAAVAALYVPPGGRTLRSCVAVGLLLGVWQTVKFGGAFVAAASVLTADALWLIVRRPGKPTIVRWLGGAGVALGSFLLVELALAITVVSLCPPEVARDALWPSYMLDDYSGYEILPRQLPGLTLFLCIEMLPLAGLVIAVAGLARDLSASFDDRAERAMAGHLFLLFYAWGLLLYLKHLYLFYQYVWVLAVAGAFSATRLSVPWSALLRLAGAATLMMMFKITFVNQPDPDIRPVILRGDLLYMDAEERLTADYLKATVEQVRSRHLEPEILILYGWSGQGFYRYFTHTPPLRNTFFVPYGYRPYDDAELRRKLDRVAAFIHMERDMEKFFSPEQREQIASQFVASEVRTVGRSRCTLFERKAVTARIKGRRVSLRLGAVDLPALTG